MKRRTRLIVELLKAVAVVVVVVQLTVLAAFCFYGADGIARWDSWRPVAVVSCAFLALLAAIQYLRRRRESRPALILQTAAALGALALHNIGSGTREDNDLFSHVITGHFRIPATDAN